MELGRRLLLDRSRHPPRLWWRRNMGGIPCTALVVVRFDAGSSRLRGSVPYWTRSTQIGAVHALRVARLKLGP